MQIVDQNLVEETTASRVWSVVDFCKRYRLEEDEETRLRKLLGDFASQQELLLNAHRKPGFR